MAFHRLDRIHPILRMPVAMVEQSTRDRNKQLKKRLHGLENKVYQYGELGVDIALIIGFREKEGGYSYTTSEEFLQRISQVVSVPSQLPTPSNTGEQRSHPKSVNRLPEDIKKMDAQSGSKTTRVIKKRRAKRARRVNASEQSSSNMTLGETAAKDAMNRKVSFFPEPPTLNLPVLVRGEF